MGGSASDAVEKLKPRSAQGFDIQTLGKGGAHINRQLDAGLGQDSAFGKGMQFLTQGAADGISNAVSQIGDTLNRSDFNVANWRRGEQKQEAQTASANYTGQSQTQRSGSGKRGSGKLTSTDKKKGKGKRALTIQK